MILAAIAFTTIFVPLSSHVYTVEEEKPYPTVTSWTEQWSSVSTSYTTEEHTKTKYTFTDDPNDSYASQDIDSLILEKGGDQLHIYLSLSRGRINNYGLYVISFDFNGDGYSEYDVILDSNGCRLWRSGITWRSGMISKLQYEVKNNGQLLHVTAPVKQIGNRTSFYVCARVGYWIRISEHGKLQPFFVDSVGYSKGRYEPPNPIDFELTYSETYTFYRTYTYTSTNSRLYTTTSTETHTLTEKVPLSYWHEWLPYPFFAGAVALAISTAIPYIKSRRKKAAPPVIALPEGARLVKLQLAALKTR
jgi:hypothetical protein